MTATPDADPRTAVVLMAYGTPRTPAEIEPYYTDIRRGRPPTPELLAELVARYDAIGGISPLAQRTEAQRHRLQATLDDRMPGAFEVVLGLKHARPSIEEAVEDLAQRGFRRLVGLVLAPHFSSFSIGQYLGRAAQAAGPHGIEVLGIESWHLLPAYVEFLAAGVRAGLAELPAHTRVLFTAHSLPQRIIDAGDPYPAQLRATAQAVADRVGLGADRWSVAWQSAGRTPEPWIGPDVLEVIGTSNGWDGVLVCACGFVADHLEVLYDLDLEAAGHAERLGLAFGRTPALNDDAATFAALAGLVIERTAAGSA
ncbi:MAG: ferrochelatase [Acidimicrobiales bacterium]